MAPFSKDETSSLIANYNNDAKKSIYYEVGFGGDASEEDSQPTKPQREKLQGENFLSRFNNNRIAVSIALLLLVVVVVIVGLPLSSQESRRHTTTTICRFCNQSMPELHEEKSYTVRIPNNNKNKKKHNSDGSSSSSSSSSTTTTTTTATITPMTVSYEYELRDGENLYTIPSKEVIPNLGFDYAIVDMTGFRNLHRLDDTPVSLDEVYLHHFSLFPLHMIGAEIPADGSYLRFPPGYALHVRADEFPNLRLNAHLISNKNLEPIGGSPARAHKECNECYYAPGKGSDCTPEVSGTFLCCGDSPSCTTGGEFCACPTTTTTTTNTRSKQTPTTTTKYRIEMDLLVSRDIDKFTRVDQWNIAAPSCNVNLNGNPVFEEYPPDSFCHQHHKKKSDNNNNNNNNNNIDPSLMLSTGGGALFHHIPEQPDENPYVRTATSLVAPVGGTLVWSGGHLHTGGVNATLYRNGKVVCTTTAVYGTDPDPSTNAKNEWGHLVRLTSCDDDQSNDNDGGIIRFETGDVFTTESYYYGATNDPNLGPGAGGEHKNVMSMFFLGVVFDGTAEYLTKNRTSFNHWNNFVPVAGMGHRLD